MTGECACSEPTQSLTTGRCEVCGLNSSYLARFRPAGKTARQLVEERQTIIDILEADLRTSRDQLYAALKIIHETPDVTQLARLQQTLDVAESLARYLADHIDHGTTPGSYEMQAARLYTQKAVSVRFRPGGDGIAGLEGQRS